MASLRSKPPPAGGRLGSPAGSAASLALSASGRSGSSISATSVPASSALFSGDAYAYPRTPENALAGETRPRNARSAHSGSATPTQSEDALSLSVSLASGATAFSSAADAHLFAPASTEDAVHAVPSLLSLLLSGRTDEQVGTPCASPALQSVHARNGPYVAACLQPSVAPVPGRLLSPRCDTQLSTGPAPAPLQVLAARKLHAYCRHSGRPVEAAIAAAGGVHMLLIMLDSLDRNLRDLCTRILTDLASDDRVRCVQCNAASVACHDVRGRSGRPLQGVAACRVRQRPRALRFLTCVVCSEPDERPASAVRACIAAVYPALVCEAPTWLVPPPPPLPLLPAARRFCRRPAVPPRSFS